MKYIPNPNRAAGRKEWIYAFEGKSYNLLGKDAVKREEKDMSCCGDEPDIQVIETTIPAAPDAIMERVYLSQKNRPKRQQLVWLAQEGKNITVTAKAKEEEVKAAAKGSKK